MTRFVLTVCCALLSAWALSLALPATPATRAPGKGGGGQCPQQPAECQVNAPVFNFGRAQMTVTAPPVYSNATISVTCTRAIAADGRDVDVTFELQAQPPAPARQMRDQIGGAYVRYDMFLDPARTRYWGDGSQGTFSIPGAILLNDRNRVGTVAFLLYGKVDGGQHGIPPGPYLGAVVSRLRYATNCN